MKSDFFYYSTTLILSWLIHRVPSTIKSILFLFLLILVRDIRTQIFFIISLKFTYNYEKISLIIQISSPLLPEAWNRYRELYFLHILWFVESLLSKIQNLTGFKETILFNIISVISRLAWLATKAFTHIPGNHVEMVIQLF